MKLEQPPQLRIGIVGCGYWGLNLVRNFADARGGRSRSLPVRARRRALSSRRAKRFAPDATLYAEFDDALAADVDALVLATPAAAHGPMALAALRAGKHTFVEKPLATTAREAARVVDAAEKRGLLMVGHTFLYSAAVLQIRDRIKSGEIGDVYYIYLQRLNLGKVRDDVNVMWNLAPHDISILLYLIDRPIVQVSASARSIFREHIPEVAFLTLTFQGGVTANVQISWLAPRKVREMVLVGSKRMVQYDDTAADESVRVFDRGMEIKEPENFGEFQLSYRSGDIVVPRVEAAEPLSLELQDFARAIHTGEVPRSHSQLGLETVAAIEAAETSLRLGGEPVALEHSLERAAA